MNKNIEEIKKLEGSPKVIKNLFSKNEIEKFMQLYQSYYSIIAGNYVRHGGRKTTYCRSQKSLRKPYTSFKIQYLVLVHKKK